MTAKIIKKATFKRCSTTVGATALFLQMTVLCALPSTAIAGDELFIPDSLNSSNDRSERKAQLSSLCNKDLAMQAEQIRNTTMSAEQRKLNYQWLMIHSGEDRQYTGGRAFSKIAQKILRQYWQDKRQELGDNALLDDKGNLKRQYNGIDYGLTTSGGGLNVGLNYTFN